MSKIEKQFIQARTKSGFMSRLNAGDIENNSIAFIEDTHEIWAKGIFYPCPYTKEELDEKIKLNTAGALQSTDKLFLIGSKTQTDNPETNTSGVYMQNNKLYLSDGKALATEESVESLKNSIDELRHELEITTTTTTYVFMVREYGDPSCDAKRFYGNQENIKNVAKHLKIAAIRNQGDYDILAPNRITLSESGRTIKIDGSDGDIMCATDQKIYLYAEKIEATDGVLEIVGIGLVPINLFGKEAIGYDPFAIACDAATYVKLTSSNTPGLETDDLRAQLHCIYNENVAGQRTAPKNLFTTTYKATGNGYASGNYTTLNEILHAQNKNEDPNTNYPYMGLYYRFVEIWMIAAMCELGTRNIGQPSLLGGGATCSRPCTTDALFTDNSGTSGVRIINSEGVVKFRGNIYTPNIKETVGAIEPTYVSFGLDGTTYACSLLPALTPHRAIDMIMRSENIGYINNPNNIFDEEGNLYNNINLLTGENMENGKRYYTLRDCPGAESFSNGVMTGVVNCYIKMTFRSGVVYNDSTDLSGGVAIFKLSTPLYRGLTWSTGHWIFLQGYHNVIHNVVSKTNPSKNPASRFVTAIFQRDPKLIKAWKSGGSYYGYEDVNLTYEENYEHDDERRNYTSGWTKACNPSVSIFHYTQFNGGQDSGEAAYTWIGQSYNGLIECLLRDGEWVDTKSINASAFGGSGHDAPAAPCSLVGYHSVTHSYTVCSAAFALLDYQKLKQT